MEGITTYLEMREHPRLQTRGPHHGGMLLRLDEPAVAFFRYLHERITGGRESLGGMSDDGLAEMLLDADRDVFVLYLGGAPAGLFELDRRLTDEVRLTRLGLLPEFRGRHLGKWFLGLAVEAAWDYRPERVWTSVGAGDDPRAILLYQWAGFVPYETTREEGPEA
ncbi:MAG: GNAT family N-acetyltransferase [Actinomycetota bacterium]